MLRRRRIREATTRVPSISGRLLVTDEHLKVHWVELSHRPTTLRNIDAGRSLSADQRHKTTLVDNQGCKRKAIPLILAVTPGKVLRTKPLNLLIRLPIQNLEAAA